MQINSYLHFSGDCAEAMRFYAELFGGKIDMMVTHGKSPMAASVGPDWQDKVMHAQISLPDGSILMGMDASPAYYKTPQGYSVSLQDNDPAKVDRVYAALADKGTVTMELQKTFWAAQFAMLTDRFGTRWMISGASLM